MAVTLKTLIEIAPFDNQTRSQLLEKLDSLTEDQKFRLSSACWTSLAAKFESQYKARAAQLLIEAQQGTKKLNQDDFKKIEDELYSEFAKLLKSAQSDEEILEVRNQLKQYQIEPFKQDAVDPNFKPRVDPSTPMDRPQDLMKKVE